MSGNINPLPKSENKYYCKCCDYGTFKKSSFDDHNLSLKHKKKHNGNQIETQNLLPKESKLCSEFKCLNCNKTYKDNSGLWKHKKNCKPILETNNNIYDLVNLLIKENTKFKQIMMKQSKQMTQIIKNNSSNNDFK